MRRLERFCSNAFLVTLSIILCLLILETYARVINENPNLTNLRNINDISFFPKPFVMSAARPGIFDHNELGYRGKLPILPKPKNEFRVFLFGGSVVYNDTEGTSIYNKNGTGTLSNKIQSLFLEKGKSNVKIYNFGAVSSNTRQDLIRFIIDASGFQPDLVAFYFGYNDLDVSLEFRPNYPHRHLLFDINPAFQPKASDTPLLAYIALSSEFMRTFFPEFVEKTVISEPLNKMRDKYFLNVGAQDHFNKRKEAIIQNIVLAEIFASAMGVDFIPVLQPILATKSKLSSEETVILRKPNLAKEFNEILKYAKEKNIEIINFSDIFNADATHYFTDNVHVNDAGNSKVARHFYQLLLKKIDFKNTNKTHESKMILPGSRFHPPLKYFQD
jgi:lysophospholipase L1-like esterase